MELIQYIEHVKSTNNWKSESKIMGESVELYLKDNLNCIFCNSSLIKHKTNNKSSDLKCNPCEIEFQVKSNDIDKIRKIKKKIIDKEKITLLGAEYKTTLNSLKNNIHYLYVLYSKLNNSIDSIFHIDSKNISEENIIPRTPLGPSARRAGWQGCKIEICGSKLSKIA